MAGELAPFLSSWTVMMAAMMLPSAMPMVRLHHIRVDDEAGPGVRTGIFVGSYLAAWALTGIPVWLTLPLLAPLPSATRAIVIALILFFAGVYELTPLKAACLRVCRSPMDFLLTHWYRGLPGELRLGFEHALYCLGCCWALMAVFVAAGAMGLVWAAGIALVVFVEKALAHGVGFSRGIGVALVLGAAIITVRPEFVQVLGKGM